MPTIERYSAKRFINSKEIKQIMKDKVQIYRIDENKNKKDF